MPTLLRFPILDENEEHDVKSSWNSLLHARPTQPPNGGVHNKRKTIGVNAILNVTNIFDSTFTRKLRVTLLS